ncbi:penicillin-binding transpeptidase domain-containing protein [Baekduia alba]|uniref:penicillin-binding transpeptidase domain-containing protein n=1 Tax=Baekduia alba TaxID=2997333 RepID=UPI0023423299|nr:penicillin-binding transpeptidase domain-containing protein [Baekduia alba]
MAIGVVVVVAGGAFLVISGGAPSEQDTVVKFARAWNAGDYATMRAQTTGDDQDRYSARAFAGRYTDAAGTATATKVVAGQPRDDGDGHWELPVTVQTRSFGPVTGRLRFDVVKDGDDERIDWKPSLVFPGLTAGERLRRTTTMPARADLLARDGTPLAQGAERSSPLGATAQAIVGALGPIPETYKDKAQELGYPSDAQVGISGLERTFDERLAGTPGGQLRAGVRLLAERDPRKAAPVRTTIAPKVQEAAVTALAGRLGGVVALRPKTGEILAAAGIGFSGLQPPGSTFKIITATGVLANGVAKPSDAFPVQTAATLEGVELQNANGESCGGTLAESFALSCNSVFAPLGAKLGAQKLVATAEAFGFNQPTGITGAATASIPPANEIGDDLAVGSSAIGQGRVQATALQMAIVAATIGLRGRRPDVTLDPDRWKGAAPTHEATSSKVARQVEKLMLGVVRYGTGKVAAIPDVKVAGKTGTAELKSTQACKPEDAETDPERCGPDQQSDTTDTDAWFSSYAPAGNGTPRIAVGVLLVGAGAGGDTAAPAARQVLLTGLKND